MTGPEQDPGPRPAAPEPHGAEAEPRGTATDPDLRRLFAALRRQEEPAAPRFASLWGEAARRRETRREASARRRFRPAAFAGAAAAAIAAVAVLAVLAFAGLGWFRTAELPSQRSASRPSAPWLADWRPPTDFLLRTPGREFLSAAPAFGPSGSLGFEPPPRRQPSDTDRRPRT
jgi:hypothetical protein